MDKKLLLMLFVGFTLFAVLTGCAALDSPGTQPGASPTTQPANEVEEPAQGVSPVEAPQNGSEAQNTPPVINLPVVGVGQLTPTPEMDEEIGSGQNPDVADTLEAESGGGVLVEGEIFIDTVRVEIQPGDLPQVNLIIQGNLPTPCHQFAYLPGQPDEEGRLNVRVFSLFDVQATCAAVLQPFEQVISLGLFPSGGYTILVNGETVQELDL